MEENTTVVNETPEEPKKGGKFKEWWRKKMVSLKRKPQVISLLFFVIPSLIYILGLGTLSEAILSNKSTSFSSVEWVGHAIFVNTLFSILILVLFLNTFPKRKKPNLIFAALTVVFAVIMILMDVLFYVKLSGAMGNTSVPTAESALSLTMVHLIFQAISIVVFATLPLYKKLIMKINTKKEIESNEMSEGIDLSED